MATKTTGLIYPSQDTNFDVPVRALSTSFDGTNVIFLDSYKAGEYVVTNTSHISVYLVLQNIAVGAAVSPAVINVSYLKTLSNTEAADLNWYKSFMKASDWNFNSLTVAPTKSLDTVITNQAASDVGTITSNFAIPNSWRRLTIGLKTAVAQPAYSDSRPYVGLLTNFANKTATTPISGLYCMAYANNNTINFRKVNDSTTDVFNVSAAATINKAFAPYRSYVTFTRAAVDSETITVSGYFNGVNVPAIAAQANALPLTGESYIKIGVDTAAFNSSTRFDVNDISYTTENY